MWNLNIFSEKRKFWTKKRIHFSLCPSKYHLVYLRITASLFVSFDLTNRSKCQNTIKITMIITFAFRHIILLKEFFFWKWKQHLFKCNQNHNINKTSKHFDDFYRNSYIANSLFRKCPSLDIFKNENEMQKCLAYQINYINKISVKKNH